MIEETKQEKILRRIGVLLAKADPTSGSTPEEAASAAAMAARLMQAYDITEAKAKASQRQQQTGEVPYEAERFWAGKEYARGGPYGLIQFDLLVALGRTFGCGAYKRTGRGLFTLLGQPKHIKACKEAYQYIWNWLEHLAAMRWRELDDHSRDMARYSDDGWHRVSAAKGHIEWNRAYYTGAVHAIMRRLAEERRRAEKEATVLQIEGETIEVDPSEVRALVVVQDQALAKAEAEFFPKLGTIASGKPVTQSSAYNKGVKDGANAPLGKQQLLG